METVKVLNERTGELEDHNIVRKRPIPNGFEKGKKAMYSQTEAYNLACSDTLINRDYKVLFALMGVIEYNNDILICQKDVAKDMGISESAFSQSIKSLKQSGIIYVDRKVGRTAIMKLSPAAAWKGGGANHKQELKRHLKLVESKRKYEQ